MCRKQCKYDGFRDSEKTCLSNEREAHFTEESVPKWSQHLGRQTQSSRREENIVEHDKTDDNRQEQEIMDQTQGELAKNGLGFASPWRSRSRSRSKAETEAAEAAEALEAAVEAEAEAAAATTAATAAEAEAEAED